jgi:hypothetical protein
VAKLGTDGPVRRSSSASVAWWTGPPPIPRRGPPRATNRMARPPRRSPPQEAARGFWIRAWGQREPALQGTGRSNAPARSPGSFEGGLDAPCQSRQMPFASYRTPDPDVDAPRSFTRWANRNCLVCFTSLAPLRRRAARGSSAHRTRPWPRRHSLPGWSAVFLKPQFRAQHERPGFPTANDHIERPLGRAC